MKDLALFLSFCSTVGRREQNQDNFLCLSLNGSKGGNIQAVLAVADGLGGEAGGEVASQIAVDYLRKYVQKTTFLPLEIWQKELRHLYQRANSKIFRTGQENPSLEGMGTTFVCAFVVDNHLIAANVGDSRLYRIRGDQVVQISRDHNMLAKMMGKKKYSMNHLKKKDDVYSSSLLQSLGDPDPPKVDFFPKKGKGFLLEAGDIYLLCSDGLTGSCFQPYAEPKDMVHILSATPNLEEACQNLTKLAYKKGSDDNITLVVLKVTTERRIITGSLRLPKGDS